MMADASQRQSSRLRKSSNRLNPTNRPTTRHASLFRPGEKSTLLQDSSMALQLIGISGKKGSGKSTIAEAIQLSFPDVLHTAFAAPLKRICIDILGLPPERVYGSDAAKSTLTSIRLRDMPFYDAPIDCASGDALLSAREVLQYVGTEIFRRIRPNCWTDYAIRTASEHDGLTIIDDVRYPNEADAIRAAGGKLIRLTRRLSSDAHSSETALDCYPHWDLLLDNAQMTSEEATNAAVRAVQAWLAAN